VAVNGCVAPTTMLVLLGITEMDRSVALVTVNVAEPEMPVTGSVALIAAKPGATGIASPLELFALLIVAIDPDEEPHVTAVVITCCVPSEYVPVAVNCWPIPRGMLWLAGVTEIDTRTAVVIDSVAVPEMLVTGSVALIVVVPIDNDVARPLVLLALLMEAMDADEEPHVTAVVITCCVPSEYLPVATYCWFVPRAMLWLAGVTEIDTRTAGVIDSVAVPEMLVTGSVAFIVVVPIANDVARPLVLLALLMEAADAFEDPQVADIVRSWCVPSEYVPVAAYCWLVPRAMLWLAGVTAIDTRTAGVIDSVAVPETLVTGSVARIVVEPIAADVAKPLAFMPATDAVEEPHVDDPVRS
jgi:hypothetical protein